MVIKINMEKSPSEINKTIYESLPLAGFDTNEISDGFHTFGELYEHRIRLFITLVKVLVHNTGKKVWRSKVHSDGSTMEGWFVLGINLEAGEQITYHLPNKYWNEFEYEPFIDTFRRPDQVPAFDGHTSEDVLERLKAFI